MRYPAPPAQRGERKAPFRSGPKNTPCPSDAEEPEKRGGAGVAALALDVAVVATYGLICRRRSSPPRESASTSMDRSCRAGAAPPSARSWRAIPSRVTIMQMDAGLTRARCAWSDRPGGAQDHRDADPRTRRDGRVDDAAGAERPPCLSPMPQPDDGVTYAAKIDKSKRVSFPDQRGAGRAAIAFNRRPAPFSAGGRALQGAGGGGRASGRYGGRDAGYDARRCADDRVQPRRDPRGAHQRAGKPAMEAGELLLGRGSRRGRLA